GVANQDETDVDCGGSVCRSLHPCAATQNGRAAARYRAEVCSSGACAAATCSDGVTNQNETDIDCGGGICSECAATLHCGVNSDCVSGVCSGGVCQATCSDGVANQDETDVDCGGSVCRSLHPCAAT